MERNHVRVQTPGLFAKGNRFEIHLECLADSQFCFPLRNGKVISAYGSRGGHSGADIKTKANDSIVCVFDGVVRMAKHYGGYGKVIVVRHENGLETLYSHNSKNLVVSGDTVKAGQVIALTGRSGRATTEHLHFELRVNGQHFSPGLLFNMQTRQPLKRTLICTKSGKHVKLQPKK
ncbi:M23 family metallopeptidase [Phocaeicola fibrisolvens]|nr:M23 family metallopeptidase [Phocaeicola fibrisolvens]MCU6779163.1 M23 family metallopeptidase [Phocaeicola fibrisolvens]